MLEQQSDTDDKLLMFHEFRRNKKEEIMLAAYSV